MSNENSINVRLVVHDDGTVKIKQFADATDDSLKKTERSAETLRSKLSALQGHWLAFTAAVAGAGAIIASTTQAFMEAEAAEMKLGIAMQNAGTYTGENLEALKAYAKHLQDVTAYEDDQTIAAMANMQTYGMQTDELKLATQAALDLASAKGIDLMTASELVGKAFVGETQTLARYGLVLDDNLGRGEKFEAVLGMINDRFGGSAQAELMTYQGQLRKLGNLWGDIKEGFGYAFIKTMEMILMLLSRVAQAINWLFESIFRSLGDMSWKLRDLPLVGSKLQGASDGFYGVAGFFSKNRETAKGWGEDWQKMWLSTDRTRTYLDGLKGSPGRPPSKTGDPTSSPSKTEDPTSSPGTNLINNLGEPLWMSDEHVAADEAIRKYFGTLPLSNVEFGRSQSLPDQTEDLIEKTRDAYNILEQMSQRTADAMEDNFSNLYFSVMKNGFHDIESVGKAALDSLMQMTADVLGQMTRMFLFGDKGLGMEGAFQSFFTWLGSAHGNVFSAGQLVPFAQGGIVNRPTVFPLGVMGENGSEAIMPLARTRTGDLGVKTVGGGKGAGPVTVINISAIDGPSVERFFRQHSGLVAGALTSEVNAGNSGLISTIRRA